MFEYLMPLLIMKNYDYTLLDETYMGAMKGKGSMGRDAECRGDIGIGISCI